MAIYDRLRYLGRRAFGLTKRPLWLALHGLTGARTQASAEYFDFGMYGGWFEADARAVAEHLPAGFAPVETRDGVVEIEIWCAEYRRIDVVLRPYNELGVIVPVRFTPRAGAAREGGYALEMPVTTEEARWAGVDNYGFPKILGEIAISDDAGGKRCVVRHRGVHVLTLQVDASDVEPFERPNTLINVRDDGRVIEAHFDMTGERSRVSPLGARLELGTHAISDELRRLGVGERGRTLYMPRVHAVLSRGVDVGPLPEATAARPMTPPPRRAPTPPPPTVEPHVST